MNAANEINFLSIFGFVTSIFRDIKVKAIQILAKRRKFLFNLNLRGENVKPLRWIMAFRLLQEEKSFKAKNDGETFGKPLSETFLLPKTTLFNANRLQIFI